MGQKTKPVQYESLIPGLQISVKKLEHNLVFSAGAAGPDRRGYLTTDDKTVQECIEAHARFKDGVIRRIPSAEELAEAKKKSDQAKRLQVLKESYVLIAELPDFSKMSDEKLQQFAESIGVDPLTKDGKLRAKTSLVKDIQELLKD